MIGRGARKIKESGKILKQYPKLIQMKLPYLSIIDLIKLSYKLINL